MIRHGKYLDQRLRSLVVGVLLLVRHGQASFGTDDYDRLSDLGHAQARRLGERLRGQDVRRLVSGSMKRQRDTALSLDLGLDLHEDGRLDEYDHVGLLESFAAAGYSLDGHPQDVLDAALEWWAGGGGGGHESHDGFVARVQDAIAELTALPGVTVAVTSGGVISTACERWLRMPAGSWPMLARVIVNASVTKVATGRSGTWLLTLNDHAHVEEDRSLLTYR